MDILLKVRLNKKFLLRERKRHTVHHVVSTPSVVLTGYHPPPPHPGPGKGGYPGYPPGKVPPAGYPPCPGPGVGYFPPAGYPLAGYPPSSWTWLGTPGVYPMAFWVMLQSIMGYGYPPVSAPWHSG